jgi:hypothetical protein
MQGQNGQAYILSTRTHAHAHAHAYAHAYAHAHAHARTHTHKHTHRWRRIEKGRQRGVLGGGGDTWKFLWTYPG